jgi:predicted nucleic acid-binding protein
VHAIVPPLWIYEVGNTVARRFPAHAQTWLAALLRFGLEEMPVSQSLLDKSLELTSRHEVSFYDAAYHALALLHKGLFVTADAKYANRASGSGSVITLAEWKPPDPRERIVWAKKATPPSRRYRLAARTSLLASRARTHRTRTARVAGTGQERRSIWVQRVTSPRRLTLPLCREQRRFAIASRYQRLVMRLSHWKVL